MQHPHNLTIPDHANPELSTHQVRPGDTTARESALQAFRTYHTIHPKLQVLDDMYPQWINEKTLTLTDNKVLFYMQDKSGAMVGFALCRESSGEGTVGEQSQLYPFRSASKPQVGGSNGRFIDRDELSRFPGYDQYNGQGRVLYIALLEVFYKGAGIGTLFVKELQSRGYALIEAEANGHRPFEFFTKRCEFKDTGLTCEDGEVSVVVWTPQLSFPTRSLLE